MKKTPNPKARKRKPAGIVRLEDLAPRARVRGGSGKLLFGERVDHPPEGESAAETETKSRPK
jgi:hypothetical protein